MHCDRKGKSPRFVCMHTDVLVCPWGISVRIAAGMKNAYRVLEYAKVKFITVVSRHFCAQCPPGVY